MHDSPETKAILRRMEEVRCDLDEGAQEIVASARDLGEWRYYVKNYPWICVGTACAVGYVIVPRRRLGWRTVNQALAESGQRLTMSRSLSPSGIRNSVLSFAMNLLGRRALEYAARQANLLLAPQSVESPSKDQR